MKGSEEAKGKSLLIYTNLYINIFYVQNKFDGEVSLVNILGVDSGYITPMDLCARVI